MTSTRIMGVLALLAGGALALHAARAQQPGIRRAELQRHDLGTPREVIQVRVELDAGATFGRHRHPGEEIIYVLEGSWEYQVEGRQAITQGRRGLVHPGRNDSLREERRQRHRGRARHVCRRQG